MMKKFELILPYNLKEFVKANKIQVSYDVQNDEFIFKKGFSYIIAGSMYRECKYEWDIINNLKHIFNIK